MMTLMVMLTAALPMAADAWGHAGGWGWWFPFALIFWLGLAASIVYVLTHVTRPRQPLRSNSARDILAERFARGEIDPDEYEERLSHLS